ncbi:ABC transporter ATP-binding protein [Meiothermus granaticius]|uniref:Putative ABC transporter ATP-binding protein YbhF n=1 Tax=Meiothermus granaticius NBRC 107808 TaxID=1227551 RepID=A0A399FCA8_9DEIN|nr:ABC transporter ATP-binding protein [Meiothermus granaticius]MCL6526967.1 ABC transporter ATP-binding protein [Thermaceae bacterium]RIH92291.1 putative ABC transporter ATP-binding protein YbhF [Meiothermus granaticius NBRC 107808]GEM86501.1 ABC transporter [Meiothermus granaticius NBRC 107808]
MIRLEKLSKRYGKFVALEALDLEVLPGETLALLGPNGAGKSTTIKALVGLLRPSGGRALVNGVDVWKEPVRAKAQFGYVPDRPYLYGKLSGLELLRFAAGVYRLPRSETEQRIEELLAGFRLERFASSLIETYSHGMRQKLSLAMSLLHQPQALILDEPMVGLDPHATRLVKDLLRDYSKNGRAVLYATHQLHLAEQVADRVALVHRGRLLALGAPKELLRQHGGSDLEEFFLRLTEEARDEAVSA